MYRVSVVGIDNSGKSFVVRSIDNIDGIGTIHTYSDYSGSQSRLAGVSGRLVNRLAIFGEQHDYRSLAGLAYLLHLAPYLLEQRAKSSCQVLVSDRDPLFDTLHNADFYLNDGFFEKLYPVLQFSVRRLFSYPDLFVYLETSPEVAMERTNEHRQLHEDVDTLNKIRELFDQELFILEGEDISVVRIDTDIKSLEEVTDEVVHTLRVNSGIQI